MTAFLSRLLSSRSSLQSDMAAFDEDANPWRNLAPQDIIEATDAFFDTFRDMDDLVGAFPQVAQAFFPFADPRRSGCLSPSDRVRGMAKAVVQMHSGLPRYMVVEAAAVCQLRCPFCSSHSIAAARRAPMMRLHAFRRFWRHAEFFTHSLDFTGGEPLLNPDLPDMVALARRSGVYVGVSTNGLLLEGEAATALLEANPATVVVSFDDTSREGYAAARIGGDFATLCRNVRRFAERAAGRRDGTRVGLRFLATAANYRRRDDFWRIAGELGVDYGLVRHYRIPPDVDAGERRRRYDDTALRDVPEAAYGLDDGGRVKPLKAVGGCTQSRHPGYVGSGGEVLACNYFPRDDAMGNAVERPFTEIWFAAKNVAMRKRMIAEGLHAGCRWCPGVWREDWFEERWLRDR